ncbi:MAG TPA: HlyD family efflux transporter periplasmic adaptor subunit [Pyrinomonadaceae bacterium]|nr:HlyD family efflux transporter periplasmic adaptor subunit [Pyrinomonadaceae bacterium]
MSLQDEEIKDSKIIDPAKEKNSQPKRSRAPIYVVSGIVVIAVIGGLIYWLYTRQFETTDDAFVEANIVQISPKISAHIVKIHVKENQYVKKNDLLIELDPSEFEAKVEKAKAELRAAQAQRGKSLANVALTRKTAKANLNQAVSNFDTAKTIINQAKLSTDSKENSIIQAQNQVKTAEAALLQIQTQIPAAEATLAQVRSQVPASEAKLEVAQIEYERNITLFNAGDVAKQTVEQSKAELGQAKSNFESAKKQIEIAQANLNSLRQQINVANARINEAKANVRTAENDLKQSQTQIETAQSQSNESFGRVQEAQSLPEQVAVEESEVSNSDAKIAQAEVALRQAELELSYTKIYAPEDGFISNKNVQEGQLVQSEQALLAVSQPEIWVVANFKETQIANIKPGQTVLVYVDAYPNLILNGTVDSFQAGTGSRFSVLPPENASGNFVKVVQRIPVKIRFDETDDRLKLLVPGMSVVPKVKVK